MPTGKAISQKMQVTGGLLGHDLGNESTRSSGSGLLAVLTSELDKRVRFSCVVVIFRTVFRDRLFKGIERTRGMGKAGDSSFWVF